MQKITEEYFSMMSDEDKKRIREKIIEQTKDIIFVPNPGSQRTAYDSKADIILFGGTAGSGKSGLILGCAFSQHRRSLIMRRQYTDIEGLTSDAMRLFGNTSSLSGGVRPKIKTNDGRLIEFGACKNLGDEQSWQGQPHDGLFFDEVTHFSEQQFRYLQTWNRTVERGQRCRIIATTNPPTSADGEWIIGYWMPFLDPNHPNPAKPGELRWYVTDPDGKDFEVDGPEPHQFPGEREPCLPKSRTFIPGKLSENIFLDSSYKATLDALPEPLRSAMRDGNFMLSRRDDLKQVIPTEWVRQAMGRWEKNRQSGVPMCAMGVDVSAPGGNDDTVLAIRFDGWYDNLVIAPAKSLKDEGDIASLILKHRRDGADIILDCGGGYGGATLLQLKSNDIPVVAYKGNESTTKKTLDRTMGFPNVRSAAIWAFREALDPSQPGGSPIALPNDQKLLGELTAPTFDLTSRGFKVETKDSVRERIGRSPDRADAVIMSWWSGKKGIAPTHPAQGGYNKNRATPRKVIMGHADQRRPR